MKDVLHNYFEYSILMDPNEVNHTLFSIAAAGNGQRSTPLVIEAESPVKRMKTVKNAVEQEGFRRAMQRDGVAMVRFLKWLEEQTAVLGGQFQKDSGTLTELSVSEKLRQLRAGQPLFRDISFDTIAAYGPHGAVVHYEPTPETDIPLQPEGLLLLDSGAQYLDGTTDITRTIALGPLPVGHQRHAARRAGQACDVARRP